MEHDLRKTVKEAEFERRKKEQEIQQLQEELIRKKREDAIRIREEIARAEQEEKELEQNLIREKAQLDKVNNVINLAFRTKFCFVFFSYMRDARIIIYDY